MKRLVAVIVFFGFCFCLIGCETTKSGAPDPVKNFQKYDKWIEENVW